MIRFVKMHGIGNDYVYVDATREAIPDPPAAARALSRRHFGIGADGLILVERPDGEADVRMRMFNADGSEGEMCGNGIRCLCKFVVDRGIARANPLRVETRRGVLALRWFTDGPGVREVEVDMGAPILECSRIPAAIPGVEPFARVVARPLPAGFFAGSPCGDAWAAEAGLAPTITLVSMGNPHAILFCEDPARVPLESVGPWLETHAWFPRRTNVHFACAEARDAIRMRTWERGSGITLACGTGACAVCVAGALEGRTERSVRIALPGGTLAVEWCADGSVRQRGPAEEVFAGEIDLERLLSHERLAAGTEAGA